ncbi:MAG TPA: L-threonylcarbamoyladenylate synthase [Pyrinomonadaceae bacterium]|nr:L-threonylcarbamoyladenylate synthase [Pyrinomonadaceae bacterium]
MPTLLTRSPRVAAEVIRRGGLVAFPTETVYGLGADIFNPAAIARIFEAKERPSDNPFIAHIGRREQVALLAPGVSDSARALIDRFFPGPLTVVLQRSGAVPDIATAGLDSIGVRMPGNELAREFISLCGTPLAAPSANLSGRPSPTTWEAVREDLDGRIDCILQGDSTEIGLESTVVDCTVEPPVLLRPGAVSLDQLREAVPAIAALTKVPDGPLPSPGLRHRHYSPRAEVIIIEGAMASGPGERSAFIGLTPVPGVFEMSEICVSVNEYARRLFEFFRECDRAGIATIYCQAVPETGRGAALMDRIRRATMR